jgi:transketolase
MDKKFKFLCRKIRKLMMESLVPFESHHIGCSLSIVEILTYLYFQELVLFPKNPNNKRRDIFILSKGHAALALYAVLHSRGFFPKNTLLSYDRNGSLLSEHASKSIPGVEVSTGSLGHGLPIGCGYALSFANDNKKNRVFVLLSDGELNEGSNWEAFLFAGHQKLSNLIVIVDVNGFQGYGQTKKVLDMSPLSAKISSFGFVVHKIHGHSFSDLNRVFKKIKGDRAKKPHCILAYTKKGMGVKFFEGKFESHYHSVDEKTKHEILNAFP